MYEFKIIIKPIITVSSTLIKIIMDGYLIADSYPITLDEGTIYEETYLADSVNINPKDVYYIPVTNTVIKRFGEHVILYNSGLVDTNLKIHWQDIHTIDNNPVSNANDLEAEILELF